MRILVLAKPVPDGAVAPERHGPDLRVDRGTPPPVLNGNDEYALEAALRLVEAHGGEVVLLAMAPTGGSDAIRRGLAIGASRAILVSDAALEGADLAATVRVLAAAIAAEPDPYDLVLAGLETSDGSAGIVGAGIAARLGLPLCSAAASIEPDPGAGTVRVVRVVGGGRETVEASLPAVVTGTQALGLPRYPSLKGIMAARSREIAVRSLADLGLAGSVAAPWGSAVIAADPPPARPPGRSVGGSAREVAVAIAELLVERRLA